MEDLADSERYAIYGAAGEFGLPAEDVYDDAPGSPRIAAYRTYLARMLEVAGYAPAEAGRIADLAIAIETELHAAKLKPVEAADPRNIYNPLTFADLQAQIPELDLGLYFRGDGLPAARADHPDRAALPARPVANAARASAPGLQGLRGADADPEVSGRADDRLRGADPRAGRGADRRSRPAAARGARAGPDHRRTSVTRSAGSMSRASSPTRRGPRQPT